MGGLDQVRHLVDDDVLEQVLGLFHQFGVQPDVSAPGDCSRPTWFSCAAGSSAATLSPASGSHSRIRRGTASCSRAFVPFVHDRRPLRSAAAGPHGECYAPVVIGRTASSRSTDGQQISLSPEVVTLALDELTGCLPRLPAQLSLLITDPAQFGDRVGADDLRRVPVGATSVTRPFGGCTESGRA